MNWSWLHKILLELVKVIKVLHPGTCTLQEAKHLHFSCSQNNKIGSLYLTIIYSPLHPSKNSNLPIRESIYSYLNILTGTIISDSPHLLPLRNLLIVSWDKVFYPDNLLLINHYLFYLIFFLWWCYDKYHHMNRKATKVLLVMIGYPYF